MTQSVLSSAKRTARPQDSHSFPFRDYQVLLPHSPVLSVEFKNLWIHTFPLFTRLQVEYLFNLAYSFTSFLHSSLSVCFFYFRCISEPLHIVTCTVQPIPINYSVFFLSKYRTEFHKWYRPVETWWHTRRNQISSFGKRTSPFKSAGVASFQSTTGSRGVRISGSNAGYTMFRASMKGNSYPLHSPGSPSLPLPCVSVCHHISTGIHCFGYRKRLFHKF